VTEQSQAVRGAGQAGFILRTTGLGSSVCQPSRGPSALARNLATLKRPMLLHKLLPALRGRWCRLKPECCSVSL